MRKLCFKWALSENVSCMEDITQEKIENQKQKLDTMLIELRAKLNNLRGVNIYSYRYIDCTGKYTPVNEGSNIPAVYCINSRMEIKIEKTVRKITWNDIYKIINSIQASKYEFI